MTAGRKYMLDLFYAERHVVGSDIRITTNVISVNPVSLLLNMNPKVDTLPAGSYIAYNAIVKDDTGGFRHEFDPQIQWTLTPANTASRLSATGGANDTFFAAQAYTTYIIGASYTVSPTNILRAFDTVYVKPGPDYRVWIEPDANINPADLSQQMKARLNNPLHVPLVQMTSSEIQKTVVGVVRDTFGNFTRFAFNSQWTEVPNTTSMINPVNGTPTYLGVINRTTNDSGTTNVRVSAKDLTTGKDLVPDQTPVSLLLGYIIKIKFVDISTGTDVTSININTDQEITVKVMGVLSTDPDTNHYVDITGMWSLTNDVFASVFPVPTTSAGQWDFSPTKPGGPSNLTVTTGSGATLRSATIPVTVTPAPPSTATFTLITPPADRIAGNTILAVVTISNHDGLVPGKYCYPANGAASYSDSLGKGTLPDPTDTTSAGGGIINTPPGGGTNTTPECFTNGLDTVKIVLYRAPYTDASMGGVDTLHQLTVNLKGITATTGPFKLLPAGLYRLQLESATGQHLTGTYSMSYPNGQLMAYSIGYDIYGNKRGKENSNWSVNQTLHPLVQTSNIPQVYYDASTVTDGEAGFLMARAPRTYNGLKDSVSDSLFVVITGPPSSLDSAVTRDVNGNGYLDRIELYFNKSVTFPADFSMDSLIIVGNITFKVDSIGGVKPAGKTGTNFVLYLHEDSLTKPGVPQTSWRPRVTIRSLANAGQIESYPAIDGAGPVIWKVTKTIVNTEDRKQDRVTVVFSEKIFDKDGASFKLVNQPGLVFTVWKRNSQGGYDSVPGVLDSILHFATLLNDSTLQFDMLNGKDLTSNEYLSISTDRQVTDQARKNYPADNNRKVPVYIVPLPPDRIVPVPNPTAPTFVRQGASVFYFAHNPSARDWVRTDRAGTVLTFQIAPPTDSTQTVRGYIKIYDVIGNLVNQASTEDVISSLNVDKNNAKSSYTYDIYWNGSNAKGTKVAAGIYGTYAYITYETPGKPKQVSRLLGTIGITQ
jgi:hypothetical protein